MSLHTTVMSRPYCDYVHSTPTSGISRPYITAQGGVLEPILLIVHIGLYTVLSYSNALICIVLYWTYYWPNTEQYTIKPYTGPLLLAYHSSTHIPHYGMDPPEYYYSVLLHYSSPVQCPTTLQSYCP